MHVFLPFNNTKRESKKSATKTAATRESRRAYSRRGKTTVLKGYESRGGGGVEKTLLQKKEPKRRGARENDLICEKRVPVSEKGVGRQKNGKKYSERAYGSRKEKS